MLQFIFLFILFVVIAAWIVWSSVHSEQKDRDLEKQTFKEHQQEIAKSAKPDFLMPKPASRGFEEWVINPGMPVRIILHGIRAEHVEKVYRLLNSEKSFYVSKDRREELVNLFGDMEARIPDMEQFMINQVHFIEAEITKLKSTFPGWGELSDALQAHKIKGWKQEILQNLPEAPCISFDKVMALTDEERAMAKKFIERFGFENLRFYSSIEKIGKPVQTDMNIAVKNAYEKLYQVGLAKKGHDIKLTEYMDTFTMKQLSDLAITNNGIFNSKEDAIQYILHDTLCLDELEKKISFSTLYQSIDVQELYEELNTESLTKYSQYYEMLTDLLISTYQQGKMAEMFKYDYSDIGGGLKFTVKRNQAICKNGCQKSKEMIGKEYRYAQLPVIPAHVGCTCVYSESIEV